MLICLPTPAAPASLVVSYSHLHFLMSAPAPPHFLDDHLQLPRISERILNDLVARDQNVLAQVVVLLLREVYPAILDHPAALFRKADDAAFRVEEEE